MTSSPSCNYNTLQFKDDDDDDDDENVISFYTETTL